MSRFIAACKSLALFGMALLLTACAHTRPVPSNTLNACEIFKENPDWYWEALETYHHWHVPVSVQMAIIQKESDFQAGARPKKKHFFGLITWGYMSSAYGYAQAINSTWSEYKSDTNRYICYRNQFADASDFIGWYATRAHQMYGLRRDDAYHLYLAYHEGLKAYAQKTYLDKPWLLSIARNVQRRASVYRQQIHYCKYKIPYVSH